MPNNSQNQNTSNEELSARIATLEDHVKELGYVLYDVVEGFRGISSGDHRCPPMCKRETEEEAS